MVSSLLVLLVAAVVLALAAGVAIAVVLVVRGAAKTPPGRGPHPGYGQQHRRGGGGD